jgi:hypothetical protein
MYAVATELLGCRAPLAPLASIRHVFFVFAPHVLGMLSDIYQVIRDENVRDRLAEQRGEDIPDSSGLTALERRQTIQTSDHFSAEFKEREQQALAERRARGGRRGALRKLREARAARPSPREPLTAARIAKADPPKVEDGLTFAGRPITIDEWTWNHGGRKEIVQARQAAARARMTR